MPYLILGIAALATAAFLLAEVATHPARQRVLSVRRAATYGRFQLATRPEALRFTERVLQPAKERLARWALRLTPKATVGGVSAKLHAAGLARTLSPSGFLAGKLVVSLSCFFFGAFLGSTRGGSASIVIGGMLLGTIGFMLPDTALTMKARGRREQIRSELPDALDLLAVSVEAGMGFDGAIQKLTEHMEGALVEEFVLALGEMRIGESRADALKRMVARVEAPELAAFVRAIIQADQLGISLGRILRVQAADARLRRQAAAEEKAMKAPIKMLFPTVLFIFPAMFLVILGPAMLTLLEIFQ
jgi:tight adherence protein C